jgi:chitin synthase
MYAYWKFDDFSWGDTRKLADGVKGGHDDAAGEFDSSQIVMKRWRDFQRERNKRLTVFPRGAGPYESSLLSSAPPAGYSASGASRSPRSDAQSSSGSSINHHPEAASHPL